MGLEGKFHQVAAQRSCRASRCRCSPPHRSRRPKCCGYLSPSAPMTEAGTPTLQLPSAWTAPVKVLPPTVTVTMSPSRRAVRLAGNNLRLPLLAGVQKCSRRPRDGVDSDHWSCGIDREIGGDGRPVTRFVADVYRQECARQLASACTPGRKRVTDQLRRRCPRSPCDFCRSA